MTRVRLTIVVDSDVYGGAEAYAAHLLRGLPERFERTLLATPSVPEQVREAAGDALVTFERPRGKADVVHLAHAGRALRGTRPDLVHVNMATATNNRHILGLCALLRMPAVATLHIVAPIESAAQSVILPRAYGRLAGFIAVSEETRRQLEDDLSLRDVRVIANGVEVRTAVASLGEEPFRVGAIGRLTEQKGFDVLIEAARRLRQGGVPVETVIAGDGPDRAALAAQADGLGVELRGFVEDVPSFHAELEAFCLPSRWEGLPFALLEAMMSGLPCVASDVGDVRLALDGVGLVVPPEDSDALASALRELAASSERRRALGAAAHARARDRFSVEKMIAQTVQVYEGALGR